MFKKDLKNEINKQILERILNIYDDFKLTEW